MLLIAAAVLFNLGISPDVIRMKSYADGLFKPTSVPVWVTINKLKAGVNVNLNEI